MAERRPIPAPRKLRLQYQFDRLLDPKLVEAYEVLVPDQQWPTGDCQEMRHGENGSHLRTRLVGSAERESHHSEPDRSSDRVREDPRIRGSLPMQFQDEGYSGATLLRPGLEAVRDLAATGQIAAVLVYSPDRLSRKYATKFCWLRSSRAVESNWSSCKLLLGLRPKINCWCSSKA